MVNSGGTIHFSGSSAGTARQRRIRALLLSSALATVLAAVIQPGDARAACDYNSNTATTSLNRTCISPPVNVSPGVAVTGQGVGVVNGTVNNSGSITSTAPSAAFNFPNAVDLAGTGGTVTYSGTGNVSSTNGSAIDILGLGAANVTVTGGTVTGNGGDAVHSIVGGATTINGTNATFVGSDDGIDVLGLSLTATLIGGSVIGTSGDGIVSGAGTTTINTTGTTVQGHDNGINVLGGSLTTSLIGGTIVGTTANGIQSNALTTTIGANGTTIQGGTNGISVLGGTFGATLINGSVVGTSGDGIHSTALATTIGTNGTTIQGGTNGINVLGGTLGATLIGGSVVGTSGDGIHSVAATSTITATNTVISGGNDGIDLVGATSTVMINSGSVTGLGGDGIKTVAAGLLGVGGTTSVTTTGSAGILGSVNGINALSTGLDTNTSTTVLANGDSVIGTTGIGISALSVSGTLTGGELNATSSVTGRADVTGSSAGILAVAVSTSVDPSTFNPNDPSTWLAGDGKAVVTVDTTGDIEGTAGSGIVALGVGNGGNDVDVTATGNVTANGGFAVLAGSVSTGGTPGTVDIQTTGNVTNNGGAGPLSGGGVLGFNTNGNTNVQVTGNVTVAQGGVIGVGAIAGGNGNATVNFSGNIDPPLIGAGTLAIGTGTAHTITGGTIDADLIGVIAVNSGDGRALVDNTADVKSTTPGAPALLGVGAVKVGNANISGDPDVVVNNHGSVTNFQVGVLGFANGTGNQVVVANSGSVNAGLLGVGGFANGAGSTVDVSTTTAGAVVSDGAGVVGGAFGGGGTVTVETYGSVQGKYLGVGGIVEGDGNSLTLTTRSDVVSSDGFGVAGLGFGDSNTIGITTHDRVDGALLGVGGLNLGDNSTVTVGTKDEVASSDGFGVFGGALGANGGNSVTVTTEADVSGKLLGVGGAIGGDGSTLNILTEQRVTSSGGFGVAGLGFGDGLTMNVTTEKTVDGKYLGVGALAFGSGSVTVLTKDKVTSSDGVGVFGGALGTGQSFVNVTTQETVAGKYLGVGGALGGDNGTLDITTKKAVTSSDGFGVAALAFGNGNAVTVKTEDTVLGSLLGVGALSFGDNVSVNVHTLQSVTATNGVGVLGGSVGTGGTVTVVTDGTVSATVAGVVGFNTGGATDVTINEKVSVADGGLVGAAAIGGGSGNATLNIKAAIDPPVIGGAAVTIGSGTATANVDAEVQATGIGIVGANIGTGAIDVNVNAAGVIKSDGIGVATFKIGDGLTSIDVDAAIGGLSQPATGGDGIFALAIGESPVRITTTGNGTITAGDDGISVNQIGGGDVTIVTNGTITAGDEGIQVRSLALTTGTVAVTNNAAIASQETGIFILKGGDGDASATANANITSTVGNGIEVNAGFGTGAVTVTQAANVVLTAADFGIIATKSFGDGNVNVTTGTSSSISAGAGGIFAGQFFGNGNVTVGTGLNSFILTSGTGIEAQSFATVGDATVTTGFGSVLAASNDGIVVRKAAGSGDVFVTTGESSQIGAGDDGITAINTAFGPGNDVTVQTGLNSQIAANDKGIRAGGWDNVTITTAAGSLIRADYDENGIGNAIRIFDADVATVAIGTGNSVIGSGKSWQQAVISVDSDDATTITVGANSVVSSWSYAIHSDLVTAASDIVIDTDGGATTITNSGTIIGRVGLTNQDDVFNNLSSNTWITVGNNYFGGGTDLVNNVGRTVTALQGTLAETTAFYGLETFQNGDPAFVQSGLLTMIDEVPGDIAFDGPRDVTYVSGMFAGVGNSQLGVDAFLGAPGSTADVLSIGGLDVDGNPIAGLVTPGRTALVVNDVNPGAGALNLQGILVVSVEDPTGITYGKNTPGNPANFVISSASAHYDPKFGGVIDKGLFFYDILVKGNDQYLVGLPDQEVFELAKLVTGAQSIWNETTGLWLDRQADLRTYLQGTPTTLVTKEGIKTVNSAPGNVTPGVWGKAVGSWASRDVSDNFAILNGAYAYDTSYSQNTYGFIAGADFGQEGVGSPDGVLLFGVLGGYITSELSFDNSPNSANYSGGTVGAYATYLNANWFFDALFKADFLSMDYSAPTLTSAGFFGQSSDVTNLGFTLDTGYRFKWGATAFVEPLATLTYVSTKIDDIDTIPGAIVDFGSNDSLRASVGARVGNQAMDTDTYRVEASLTGRLWYEFLGDNAVTVFNPGAPFVTTDTFDGLFGEVGAGVNIFGKGNGWNGFTNVSLKFGDSYTAGNARGGIRYQW